MEKNYDFRRRLNEVHKKGRANPEVYKKIPGTLIDDSWEILYPSDSGRVMEFAAHDLRDYLEVSMGVYVKAIPCSSMDFSLKNKIFLTFASLSPKYKPDYDDKLSYRLYAGENIVICGTDERGTAQGCYFAEDRMNLNEGPVLRIMNISKKPVYSPRMIHSGFGIDMFPNEQLITLAHAGIDTILVFTKNINITAHGYLDFNDLIYRANGYGLDVYAYSYYISEKHPSDPDAKEFYENTYGKLFRECPGLKGVVVVGESCGFPSKDERTTGTLRLEDAPADRRTLPTTGYFPCRDYPEWINFVKNIIREYNPEADFVFWTYNWGYVNEKERLELIRTLPTDISLLVTFEMFEEFHISPEVTERTVDYTLWFEGPGKYFASEAEEASKRGIRLYAQANSAGLTWDIGTVPYQPAPYQWKKRWDALLGAHHDWNLTGLMDSHHYGYWPSFIGELAKASDWAPIPDFDTLLHEIASRDFGAENAKDILEVWRLWSEGSSHCVSTNEDQYGPFRIGPSYPLLYRELETIPAAPYAHFGNHICYPMYRYAYENMLRLLYELKEISLMQELYARGCEILKNIIPKLPAQKADDAKRMYCLGRFIENSAHTVVNVKKWHILKGKLGICLEKKTLWSGGRHDMEDSRFTQHVPEAKTLSEKHDAALEMLSIAEDEIRNARNTIPLVEFDSRLGFEPSMEYMTDKAHLEWKISVTEKAVNALKAEFLQ